MAMDNVEKVSISISHLQLLTARVVECSACVLNCVFDTIYYKFFD